MKRTLGRSGIEVSAVGMGCWAIGGPWTADGTQAGWGEVDDRESVRAIRAAIAAGATFFDTAANYGAGHSERVLGEAIAGCRDEVVVATKFGYDVDEGRRAVSGTDARPEAVRRSCEASLRRLGTDVVDVLLFHVNEYPSDQAPAVRETLEHLVSEGKIRCYGWSTDDVGSARVFAAGEHCAVVEHQLNVFEDSPAMLALCEEEGLASVARGPLAMGLLTGKYSDGAAFSTTDIRAGDHPWMVYFEHGRPNPEWLARIESVREILTSRGRSLAQGALAWIWARSPITIPIPGFRTVEQAEANARAMELGPLTAEQMAEIDSILTP
jgi:aryl-alcohol dehydrogenase-like predicted oxidoreductase